MSEDGPREYDQTFTKAVEYRVRRRIGYTHDHGTVTRFMAQLEFYNNGEWHTVVRFDHDPESEHGHDVSTDGVHMDIYRDGDKYRVEEIFPPMTAGDALTFAEGHLKQHAQRYIKRFEQWHEIKDR